MTAQEQEAAQNACDILLKKVFAKKPYAVAVAIMADGNLTTGCQVGNAADLALMVRKLGQHLDRYIESEAAQVKAERETKQ